MYEPTYLAMCVFCMLQLGFIAVMETRRRNIYVSNEKYFLIMVVIAIVSFAADAMSILSSTPGWVFPISVLGIYVEISLNTLLMPIFVKYVCGQMTGLDRRLEHRVEAVIWTLFAVCLLFEISTFFNRYMFYFDAKHVYHRGPYFMVPMLVMLGMMMIIELFIISQRQKIEAAYYRTLIFFLVAPLVGWTLQSLIYGLPFSLMGIALAAQLVFTNIQNRNIDKDYLTGAFNRQTLDNYIGHKIDVCMKENKRFSALLLDIDNFKTINDRFGHFEGDVALIKAVAVLRESVGRKDFIGRYGGDEFCVVLESGAEEDAAAQAERIRDSFIRLNAAKSMPYDLSLSMGSAVCDQKIRSVEAFYKLIDKNMYRDKKEKYRRSVRWHTACRVD